MSTRNFERLFNPRSIVLVGVSDKPHSVGNVLLHNVITGGFTGAIYPVNPNHAVIDGITVYPDIASLPQTPDLAVICTAAAHVPDAIEALGKRGTRAAVVISAGFGESATAQGKALEHQMLEAASRYGLRIIGPNCVGIMVPGIKLNASFAHLAPAAGTLAFVSQSGALCTAVLDTVAARSIGFSHFISLGNAPDVDFGDMLDYLAGDPHTSAILLYIESVTHVRKFMSAARAAARVKPVIVIKSGRNAAGAKAAASHTGALIGSDAVYEAAFKRAGMVRVYEMEELFDAVETLARLTGGAPRASAMSEQAESLVILTNGGGPAVLATDYLVAAGGALATLSEATIQALNAVLPPTWSHGNPVDIIGDADGLRYAKALDILLKAPEATSIAIMNCPTAVADNHAIAQTVIETLSRNSSEKTFLTCWLGDKTAQAPRLDFAKAGIASYETPEKAMRAFIHIAQYRHNQAALLELPSAEPKTTVKDTQKALAIIEKVRQDGRDKLYEHEAKNLLEAYAISVVKTIKVTNAEQAAEAAQVIGFPVVLKIISPQISHKSDIGGVALGLESVDAVVKAAHAMRDKITRLLPTATLEGFSVQQMVSKPQGYELIVGVSTDRQFGPVVMFGAGGVAVEVIDDKALGLPPLTAGLAEDMIQGTRIYRQLHGFRDRKPVPMEAMVQVLMSISQMVADIPAIAELDINPLLADSAGLVALDARVKLEKPSIPPLCKLVISPYPQALEEMVTLADGDTLCLRPVRPEDGAALKTALEGLAPQDLYHRFYREFPMLVPATAARLSQVDYDREMVLVAVKGQAILGCLSCTMRPEDPVAEFSLLVHSAHKGRGIGTALMGKLIGYLRSRPDVNVLTGYALRESNGVIDMTRKLGFLLQDMPECAMVQLSLTLN